MFSNVTFFSSSVALTAGGAGECDECDECDSSDLDTLRWIYGAMRAVSRGSCSRVNAGLSDSANSGHFHLHLLKSERSICGQMHRVAFDVLVSTPRLKGCVMQIFFLIFISQSFWLDLALFSIYTWWLAHWLIWAFIVYFCPWDCHIVNVHSSL